MAALEENKKTLASGKQKPAGRLSFERMAAPERKAAKGQETAAPKVLSKQSRDDIRLSFLIHDVSRMRRAAYNQFIKPLGITREKWWVLAILSRSDGMMQTRLAGILEVGKASLGDVLGSLESGGLISRLSDPSDKRAKRVFLTPLAQSLVKRMTTMEIRFNNRVFAKLSANERSKLFETLLTVKQSIAQFAVEENAEPLG